MITLSDNCEHPIYSDSTRREHVRLGAIRRHEYDLFIKALATHVPIDTRIGRDHGIVYVWHKRKSVRMICANFFDGFIDGLYAYETNN